VQDEDRTEILAARVARRRSTHEHGDIGTWSSCNAGTRRFPVRDFVYGLLVVTVLLRPREYFCAGSSRDRPRWLAGNQSQLRILNWILESEMHKISYRIISRVSLTLYSKLGGLQQGRGGDAAFCCSWVVVCRGGAPGQRRWPRRGAPGGCEGF
jgi:hypothetical protein